MYLTNWTIIIEVNVYGLTTSCVFFLYTNPHTITTQIFLWSWELLFRFTLRKWWFSSTLTCPLQPHTAPHKITLLIFFTLLQDDLHTKFVPPQGQQQVPWQGQIQALKNISIQNQVHQKDKTKCINTDEGKCINKDKTKCINNNQEFGCWNSWLLEWRIWGRKFGNGRIRGGIQPV